MEIKDLMDLASAGGLPGFVLHKCSVESCGVIYDLTEVKPTDPANGKVSHGYCKEHLAEAWKAAEEWVRGQGVTGA